MNKKYLLGLAFGLAVTMFTACGDDSNSSSANSPDILYQTSEGLIYSDYTVRDESGKIIGLFDDATNEVTLSDGTVVSLSEDDLIAVSSSSENFGWWQSSSSFTGNVDKPNWAYLNPDIDYGTFKDIRDGQVYKTVKIGTQTWMAENLNYPVDNSWCYNDSVEYCDKYGRLYTWVVAIDSVGLLKNNLLAEGDTCGLGKTCTLPEKVQGICPEGWHLPTNAEWDILEFFIAENQGVSTSVVSTYLKSPVGWEEDSETPVGLDTYGFSALPAGGLFISDGSFDDMGIHAYFWSASEDDYIYAYRRGLYYGSEYFGSYSYYKIESYSVRCLKD